MVVENWHGVWIKMTQESDENDRWPDAKVPRQPAAEEHEEATPQWRDEEG